MSSNLGFLFSSATCGFKKSGKPDLAVIYSPIPCTYGGTFTTNQVRAACVDENKRLLKNKKKIKAIVINSGNANASTGKKGIQAVKDTKQIAAKLLKINPDDVLVASTGAIGILLDMEKIKKGLEFAIPKLSSKNLKQAAKAILTTDKYEKIITKQTFDFKIIGFTKGAGMIHPNMATMLCYLITDLNMSQELLQSALKEVVSESFNLISVDADMSTNDMVILLSNNKSKKKILSKNDSVYLSFKNALLEVCTQLAKLIALDGEGAKRLISVSVNGAKTKADAKEIARSIVSSNLFKCAIFGLDPNWGRAAARVGSTSVKVEQNKLDLMINNTFVYKNGTPMNFDKKKLHKQLKKSKEVKVGVNLKLGKSSAKAYGCDMSYEYVKLNSAYST